MGMNYYCIIKKCWFCGNKKVIHIGKASAGTKFLFQVNSEYESDAHGLFHYLQWRRIEDEMHRRISRRKFFEMIGEKEVEKSNTLCNLIDKYSFEWSTIEFS